ncbi:putative house-cleaning NTP pyrophosphatase (Maf/HAM1 superfamily) [Flavobacterium sp. CG_23.5]|uniref:hypothetical protein n=1 Tax=unclassified Flavobacterium TaxID=196869 RepID=UPI0018C9A299|nr:MULTISPECIES: hypothetical protein [unclassified Flavobacterium]MBG6111499.1 putative house-cleaning NTP pyrophosphatase (Maf/HAM1 superfamily) [Flavobacterium sp. CG_9.10]MBP2282658.1 putative house-cleaning NTP pyrophosphatase (Maf/HAM1 superfamily) [Flavobacterium sp. CG_23.5]
MTLILDSTSAKKISLLKELALQLGVKVTEMPKKNVGKSKIPNEVSLKSMAKTDKGIGLTKAKSPKDMMQQIFSK